MTASDTHGYILGAYKESPADYSCVAVAEEAGVTFDVVRNSKGTSELWIT